MVVLSLDTTSEKGGVALFRGDQCLAEEANAGPAQGWSVTLFQMVTRLLDRTSLRLDDIELYAVANGPGSFTGIRVGMSAALAWSKAFNRPLRGVSVLHAMVEAAGAGSEYAMSLLDAHRSEFYVGVFRRQRRNEDVASYVLEEDWVLKPDAVKALAEKWGQHGLACIAREHDAAARSLTESPPGAAPRMLVPGILTTAVARLALRSQDAGKAGSTPDAYYIRRPDAELNWQG
jgi:tRNA threonylcarbamoyl adenosine modification protein YeaZ